MPKRPYEWRIDAHGCYKFDNAELGFAPRDQTAHFPVFLHFHTSNIPDSILRSSQAQQRRLERAAGKNDRLRQRKRLAQQAASNPLATQPKSSPPQTHNTTPTAAFSQHCSNGKTRCPGSRAASRRLCTSAPSVNDSQCFLDTWHSALASLAEPGVPCRGHFRDVLMRRGPVSPFPCQRCWPEL